MEALDRLVLIDQEIDQVMEQIQVCSSLPPPKRALATTRLHFMLRVLEDARWQVAKEAFPEATKNIPIPQALTSST